MFSPCDYLFISSINIKFALTIIKFIDLRGTRLWILHANCALNASKFETIIIVTSRVGWCHWLKLWEINRTCCVQSRIYLYWNYWGCYWILKRCWKNYYLKLSVDNVWRIARREDLHCEIVSSCKRVVWRLNLQRPIRFSKSE